MPEFTEETEAVEEGTALVETEPVEQELAAPEAVLDTLPELVPQKEAVTVGVPVPVELTEAVADAERVTVSVADTVAEAVTESAPLMVIAAVAEAFAVIEVDGEAAAEELGLGVPETQAE